MKPINVICLISLYLLIQSRIEQNSSRPKNPTILQISTRPWLYELSQTLGQQIQTLSQIPTSILEDIKTKQFDYLWLMGVWQVGDYGITHDRTDAGLISGYKQILPDWVAEDAIGSPYSITDYVCNKELCPNGNSDLSSFKSKLNAMGIKLMLDFVPNHSALDSPWVEENRDYFIRKHSSQSGDDSRFYQNDIAYGNMQWSSAWTDVAQLNYYNQDTRELMKAKLKNVAEYADGVRCDMAYIVLNDYFYGTWKNELDAWGYSRPSEEFWYSAIKEAKDVDHDVLFLAEVYGDYYKDLIANGFDYTYDKVLLDKLETYHLDNIRGWIKEMIPYNEHVCRFLENHDDNRAVSFFGYSVTKTDAAALVAYTLPGLRFFFQDQWYGYKNKLDVHLRRSKAEDKSTEAINFYNKFFPIITDETFKNGDWKYLNVYGNDAWRLMAWSWANSETGQKRLVVVNFSEVSAYGAVVVSDVSGSGSVTIKELLTGAEYIRNADEMREGGLNVIIDAYSAQIFSYN